MSRFIFSITAGRTGTAWITNFLGENLGIKSIHEPLGIDDFGNQMPDIKTMRMFNERGLILGSEIREYRALSFLR
jgi:hypothetical protein